MLFVKGNTLFNIASGGAVIVMGMAAYMIRRQENIYRDSNFFKEAMHILEANEGATKLLGANLSASRVYPTYDEEETSPVASFTAHVKGSKNSGELFFWAERIIEDDQLRIEINKIELEIGGDKSKRLLVK